MAVNLPIDIMLYIREIPEFNFDIYALYLKDLIKWIFAIDHCNYVR